jgi:uncharacterized membrane protein HdeD (DUF308 family)
MRAALAAMCAGAAVSAVHAVVYASTAAAEKAAIEQKYPHLSPADVTTVTHITVIGGSIAGWISVALFLGVARACRPGQDWARVAGSVFFVIGALGLLWNATHADTTLNLWLGVAEVAAGLVAVTALWQRSSGRYFESFRRPRS